MMSVPAHWIKANEAGRIPSRFVWLDTEAQETNDGEARVQTWRLGVTCFDARSTATAPWREPVWQAHRSPAELWAYVDRVTRAKARTVVVAHNLAYDLRISRAFDELSALGWFVHRLSVHDRSVAAVLRRDNRTLVLADSMSWLPMGLAQIGAMVGTRKVDLPSMDDPDDEWLHRCVVDVSILRRAMLDLIEWIDADNLGNWQRTGAGQAWATWRHRFYTHKVLVHDEPEARAAEVTSIYTGRCEAWRWGRLRTGPYTEWDLPLAYPTICADAMLPVKLVAHGSARSTKALHRVPRDARYLCRATVQTPAPTLPWNDGERTLWPVGELTGWWWDDELVMAESFGAQVRIHETWVYRAAPALAAWATWILDYVQGAPDGATAVRQAAAKHQSRALIGRFATKYTVWETDRPALDDADPLEYVIDLDAGKVGRLLTLGSETLHGYDERYGADTVPAIMSAVMAECRIRLWSLMALVGLQHVVYVDTDSLMVDPAGDKVLAQLVEGGGGWGLRRKGEHDRLHVLGPRQLVVDGGARIAGVPKNARQDGAATWAGETWSGLLGDLARGRTDSVTIRPGVWKVRGVDHRRVHLPGGDTAPVAVGWHVGADQLGAAG